MLSLLTAFLPAVILLTTVHGNEPAQGLLQSNAKWASNINASISTFFATSAQGQDPKVGHRVLQHVNSSLTYLHRFYGLGVLIHACQSRSLLGRFQEFCSSRLQRNIRGGYVEGAVVERECTLTTCVQTKTQDPPPSVHIIACI